MKINDLYKYNCVLFMHKFAYARHPNSILNMFTPLRDNQRTGSYILQKSELKFLTNFHKFPHYDLKLTKTWQKNWRSYASVKTKLKDKIISTYNREVVCKFQGCPHCSYTKWNMKLMYLLLMKSFLFSVLKIKILKFIWQI